MWGIPGPEYPIGTRLYPKRDTDDYALVTDTKCDNWVWSYLVSFDGTEEWLSKNELLEKYSTESPDAGLMRWAKENGWIFKKKLD
jgi:hypothetical protein